MYGKRQTFPSPTAEPTAAATNPACDDHIPRFALLRMPPTAVAGTRNFGQSPNAQSPSER
jgi:hypothetical protein